MLVFKRSFSVLAVLATALVLSGCAGSVMNMTPVTDDMAVTVPEAGKALVVFMRPSTIGFAIQSSVHEIITEQPALVGIVAAKKKVSYQVEPGKHLFMVVGESADFMSADLVADKTYYALVTPRLGVWKARFSLKPVTAAEANSADLNSWLNECQWVAKSSESGLWESKNMASNQSMYSSYFTKWMSKAESDKPKLLPGDGI